jgi:hypothetical protein
MYLLQVKRPSTKPKELHGVLIEFLNKFVVDILQNGYEVRETQFSGI